MSGFKRQLELVVQLTRSTCACFSPTDVHRRLDRQLGHGSACWSCRLRLQIGSPVISIEHNTFLGEGVIKHGHIYTLIYIQRQRNVNTTHIQVSTLKPNVLKPCSMCILNISINVNVATSAEAHHTRLIHQIYKTQHPRKRRKTCPSMCRMFLSPPVINDPILLKHPAGILVYCT